MAFDEEYDEEANGYACRYCKAAGEVYAEECDGHDEKAPVVWLAKKLARLVHEELTTDAHVGWFMGDAEAILGALGSEFDPEDEREIVVAKLPDTPGGWTRIEVNGRTFVVDPNAEGESEPGLMSDYDFDAMGWPL